MRRFISVLLCAVLCLLLSFSASASGTEVTELVADVVVFSDGSCNVTLTATVHFLTAQKQFIFPLAADADDINASGASYDTDEIGDVECVIFERSSGFSGDMTFVCSYSLSRTVTEKDDGTQLFSLQLPEKGWQCPIERFSLSISFPSEVTAYPSWYSAYHGVDIENYLDISINGTQLSVNSFDRFKDQETLSMELKFDAGSFELSHLPGQTVSVVTVLFWLVFFCTLAYWFLRLRRKHLHPSARHTPVNEATAGEIPCQLFGLAPEPAGILAHWGNLGYLTISRSRNGRILLRKQMEMGSERTVAERKLFYSLFKNGDTIDALNPRVLSVCKKIGVLMQRSWTRRLYRKNTGSPYILRYLGLAAALLAGLITFDLLLPANFFRWILLPILAALAAAMSYVVQKACLNFYARRRILFLLAGSVCAFLLVILSLSAGCFGIMLMSLSLQIFCSVTTMFGGLRESSAEDLVCQLLGLRAFLRSASPEALQRLNQADGMYFYRMLPFAEQLGVASAFSRRCGVLQCEPCPWLSDALSEPQTAPEFYHLYSQIMAAIRKEPALSPMSKPAKEASYV